MKAIITALAVTAICGSAFAADPVAQRTPNGGMEYYSNSLAGTGTVENGCILPWRAAGHATIGYNPKLVHYGDPSEFFDCYIQPKAVVAVEKTQVVVVVVEEKKAEVVAPAPAPVPMAAPAPIPMATPAPEPQMKKIRE